MKYIIQAAHANTLEWRDVDQFSEKSDIKEYFSSPSFEYFDGMLVRLLGNKKIIYIGVFVDDHVVDLGSDSEWISKINDKLHFALAPYAKPIHVPPYENFVDAWMKTTGVTWKFYLIGKIFPPKPIYATRSLFARTALLNVDNVHDDMWKALDVFDEWIINPSNLLLAEQARLMAREPFAQMSYRENWGQSIDTPRASAAYAALMSLQQSYDTEYVTENVLKHRLFLEPQMDELLKLNFPLHDVILRLAKL